MNSYGDPSSARGRARPSGYDGDYGLEAEAYRSSSDYGQPPAGRAQVGRAQVGRAQVRGAAPVSPAVGGDAQPASGRASVGRAVVGSASVGGASGSASVSGRATVGRASVRPVSPAGPKAGGTDGGPGGPGGTGPGRRGRKGGGSNDPAATRRAKRRRRLNWIIALFAVFIMLSGVGVVGFSYYSTKVVLPDQIDLPFASTLYYSDGKTQLAKLGEVNRTFVNIDQIPEWVRKAVVSAEDRKFYEHSGVDYVGIARAAWNNLTGGSRQGASTITQQYAKNAMKLTGGYDRKLEEAILASKLNDRFTKDEILQHYLNIVYFGRGAYGIEAAAQTYFKKSVDKLTVAEGAVLAAVIKQPEPDSSTGHKGFDPGFNPEGALDRWNYVLNGMVEHGWLKAEERPTEYPNKTLQPLPKEGACFNECGIDKPTGNVINYLRDEFMAMGLCTEAETCVKEIKGRGYRIVTSINKKMQAAAEAAAWRAKKNSVLAGQPKNLMAALVAVEPKTGRVLAYFGGPNGTGHDFAGKNIQDGQLIGGHPPGSSFKVYTLAAALEAGIALDSHWDATPFRVPGTEIDVENAGRGAGTCGKWCSLEYSTLQSYNVPFYHITAQIGPDKVVDMAKAAGITMMWDNNNKPYDLTQVSGKDVAPDPFFTVLAYGQYPVTVLDHANGMATFANRGVYNKAHFVVSVERKNEQTGKWEKVGGEKLDNKQRIRPAVVDDVTSVLAKIPQLSNDQLAGDRPAGGKTGTWQLGTTSDNAHAWMVGYTPQVAAAVWLGNEGAEKPIKDRYGNNIGGAGLPADIWKRFMDEAHKGMDVQSFPDRKGIGNPDVGNGTSPAPKPPEGPPCLLPDPLCPSPGTGGNPPADGGGNPPGGGGRGGGGWPGLPPDPTPTIRMRW